MKILKPVASGFIIYEDFSTSEINTPLKNNATLSYIEGGVLLEGGSIDLDAYSYNNVVFEIKNNFIPLNDTDMGGIRLSRGLDRRELYEYNNGATPEAIPYVRVSKVGDVYTGYSSHDGMVWEDKGYLLFPFNEKIGVDTTDGAEYELNSISVYKSEYVKILTLIQGWTVKVSQLGEDILTQVADSDSVSLKLPYYPFTGTIRVYNEVYNLVAETVLSDVWGGDEYSCSVNVSLLALDEVPLSYDSEKHLGNLSEGVIENKYIARNLSDESVTVTIKIADYSPFYSWANVSKDTDGVPTEYLSSIEVIIPANSDIYFWVKVDRPVDAQDITFDFTRTECLFYLSVS